jgi:hypothetical protein
MESDTPVHDFLRPRVMRLVEDAVASGITREVAVAVLIDLVTSPAFDTAAPDPASDSEPHNLWNRGPDSVVLVGGSNPGGPPAIDAQDQADFVKPLNPFYPS